MIDTTPILSPDRNPEPERLYSRAQTESVTGTTTLPAGRASGVSPLSDGSETPAGRVRFSDLTHCPEQREKVLRREAAVLRVQELQRGGIGVEMALRMVRDELRESGIRPNGISAIRSWCDVYPTAGLDGLVEQKLGKVGRKSVEIPEPILNQAKAASVEHGTLGKLGRQNIARAFREVVISHPDATDVMRDRFHNAHASKSYVPQTVRRMMAVAPGVRDLAQGPKAARLHSPYTPHDWSQVKAGRVVTGDDMTMNVYAWVEWPNAQGFLVVRPQLIALLDCGSLRWLVARVVIRPNGQYNSDDVWGVIGDLADGYGVYPEFLFEGGIWRSNQVRGHRTGLSDDERFGGLRTFGAILRHAHTPRAKPIEERFNQFQYAFDRLAGYSGRFEREDCPEKTKALLAEIRAGKVHPRGHLLHLRDLRTETARVMDALNNERQDGIVLRGMCPNEKWELDAPKFAVFPDAAKWLYRSTKSVTQVRRDGQLRIQLGSGRFSEAFLYRSPELMPMAGRRVIAYWNQDLPEAACSVLDAVTRKFLCTAAYVRPMPRFDATPEQWAANGEQLKEYRRAVRAEHVNLAPHYTRTHTIPVDAVTAENGERLVAAREAAEAKKKTSRRVASAVDVDIADDLADYRPQSTAAAPLISDRDLADILGDHPLTQ